MVLDDDGSKGKVEIPRMPSSKAGATEKTKHWIGLKQTTQQTAEVTLFPSFDMKFHRSGATPEETSARPLPRPLPAGAEQRQHKHG